MAHFLRQIAKESGQRKIYAPEAVELLATADWPGNVRQLQNVVRQNVALSQTPIIPVEARAAVAGRQPDAPAVLRRGARRVHAQLPVADPADHRRQREPGGAARRSATAPTSTSCWRATSWCRTTSRKLSRCRAAPQAVERRDRIDHVRELPPLAARDRSAMPAFPRRRARRAENPRRGSPRYAKHSLQVQRHRIVDFRADAALAEELPELVAPRRAHHDIDSRCADIRPVVPRRLNFAPTPAARRPRRSTAHCAACAASSRRATAA